MSTKVPVNDNAGVFVRLIDRSQIPADPSPNQLYGAMAVFSERGFINRVYRVTDIADRQAFFGRKDWRKYGRSLHCLDKHLEGDLPAYVVRAGNEAKSTLAGASFYKEVQQGAPDYGFANERGVYLNEYPVYFAFDEQSGHVDGKFTVNIEDLELQNGDYIKINEEMYKWLDNNIGFVNNLCEKIELPDNILKTVVIEADPDGKFYRLEDGEVVAYDEDLHGSFLSTAGVRGNISHVTVIGEITLLLGESITVVQGGTTNTFIASSFPKGQLESWSSEGKFQADVEQSAVSGGSPVVCEFFANGEGEWGNRFLVRIAKAVDDRYEVGDNKKLFDLSLYEAKPANDLVNKPNVVSGQRSIEGYDFIATVRDLSFDSQVTDASGISCYIEDKLPRELPNFISTVVNINIDPEEIILPSDEIIQLKGGHFEQSNDPDERSSLCVQALNKILSDHVTYDSILILNAGQEILNAEFNNLVDSYGRGVGITACDQQEAFQVDRVPQAPDSVTSRFVAKYNQWLLVYDSDAKQDIYVPPTGWISWIIGRQHAAGQLPYAPAGYRRGVLNGVKGLSRKWNENQRLEVTKYQWNPIKHETGIYIVWDALTSHPLKSAFSNIHVGIAYQVIRRGIENTLKGFEFEFNDEQTLDTMLTLLKNLADNYMANNYAERIEVSAPENRFGTDQIRIQVDVWFKEAARTIVVDVIANRSDQSVMVSERT